MAKASTTMGPDVIGIDLGDRASEVCVLRGALPEPVERRQVSMTARGLTKALEGRERSRVVMEAGTHSPWVSRLVESLGHEVIVANPRQVALISGSDRKTDRSDAEMLARLARADVALLRPIRHRTEGMQRDLEVLRARDALVRARTLLINHVRGAMKSWGVRINSGSSEAFVKVAQEQLPDEMRRGLLPTLRSIATLTTQIGIYDKRIAALCGKAYPATTLLRQVNGVGPVTSLAFVLTIADPNRFRRHRQVGAYLGLRPRSDQSGSMNRQLGIAKSGDRMVRRLLVQAAHHILGPFGPDTTLRRFGQALATRGAGNAKKRAVVAVARRLAVLLLRLWRTGEVYEPLYGQKTPEAVMAQTP